METLTIELPQQREQTAFNLQRWAELIADPDLAKFQGRIETDRHGHVIMSPPAAASHGRFEFRIGKLLEQLLPDGEAIPECPISTADGVKAADVAWASREKLVELGNRVCFPQAPEICVEVISPGNTKAEIEEKKMLYFNAGAKEVWICSRAGEMEFFVPEGKEALPCSRFCPRFPKQITLS